MWSKRETNGEIADTNCRVVLQDDMPGPDTEAFFWSARGGKYASSTNRALELKSGLSYGCLISDLDNIVKLPNVFGRDVRVRDQDD